MRARTLDPPPSREMRVGKRKGKPEQTRQVNFRCPPDLYEQIEETAQGLGLDVANFLRMVIKENLHTYKERAALIREQGGGKS